MTASTTASRVMSDERAAMAARKRARNAAMSVSIVCCKEM
jgi:hypothetical protein